MEESGHAVVARAALAQCRRMSVSSLRGPVSLALISIAIGCGGSGGGGTDASIDASAPPGVDAPRPAECSEIGGRDFDVDVIGAEGFPQPPDDAPPLAGAAVRVAHRCGQIVEGVTDASGHAHLDVDGPRTGWALTVAMAGRAAVSILDLEGSPEGPIRIDRPTPRTFTPVAISGTITGAGVGARVLLDSYDFDTQDLAGNGPWSTQQYTRDGAPPLLLVALELTDGTLTNLATTTIDPRPSSPTTDVTLAFAPPTETPVSTRVTVSGVEGASFAFSSVLTYHDTLDGAWVTPGSVVTSGNEAVFTYMPSLAPTHGFLAWDSASHRTVAIVHSFPAGPVSLTAPVAFGLGTVGGRSSPLGAVGNASAGIDALVLHVDEGGDHGPRWRVYCSPTLHTRDNPCFLPALPSTVTPSDLGIMTRGAQALAMMQTAHEGSLWSGPGTPFPSSRLDWQLASSYVAADIAAPYLAP